MDMSGHRHFRPPLPPAEADGESSRLRNGERLLAAAWAGLASTRSEAVDIHLRSGQVIERALALRIEGRIAEAACRAGWWTHAFAIEDVVLVRQLPRGQSRTD